MEVDSKPEEVDELDPTDNTAGDETTIGESVFEDGFEGTDPPGAKDWEFVLHRQWLPVEAEFSAEYRLHVRRGKGVQQRVSTWDPAGFWVPGSWTNMR